MVTMKNSVRMQVNEVGFQVDKKAAELAGGPIGLVNSMKFHKSCCYIDMKLYYIMFSVLLFTV